MIVKSGKFVTAGAALSHMDLRPCGSSGKKAPGLRRLTAKYLVVDFLDLRSPSMFSSII